MARTSCKSSHAPSVVGKGSGNHHARLVNTQKNLCRHPGTRLYEDMVTRADTDKVVLIQKQ
jgi:hypothetical protein